MVTEADRTATAQGRHGGRPAPRWWLAAAAVALGAAVGLVRAIAPPAPPPVRMIEAPGVPVLYVVDLPAARSLRFYLDPGAPGVNGIHATFFDREGRELETAGVAKIAAGRPGAPPTPMPVLQEGPGHFYSDFDFGPGEWRLSFSVPAGGGTVLQAAVTIRLPPSNTAVP